MMVRYYVTIGIMLVIMIFQYRRYRNIIAAPVIYPVMWMMAIFVLTLYKDTYYLISTGTFVIFVTGYVMFCLGFGVAYKHQELNHGVATNDDRKTDNQCDISDQRIGLNAVVIICLLVGALYAIVLIDKIDFKDFLSSWMKIRKDLENGDITIPYVLQLARYFIRCALWYFSLQLFSFSSKGNYKTKDGYNPKADLIIKIFLVLLSSMFIMISDLSRNDILFTLLPILFIFVIEKRLSTGKIIAILAIGLLVFSLFFVYFRELKGGSLFNDDEEIDYEGAHDSYVKYLCGSLVAFEVKLKSGDLRIVDGIGRGRYTFSLITSISDRIYGTENTPEVIREWRQIGKVRTNVYTVYEWTGMDFGVLVAVFIQSILGAVYGHLYYGVLQNKQKLIFLYSVLFYSLLMMFFEDQFFSISQSWLIIGAICYGMFLVCNRAAIKIRR